MSFTIRPMNKSHIDDVLEIEHLCFEDPWSRESMEHEAETNEKALYYVGIEVDKKPFGQGSPEEKIVAYSGLWTILDEGHITNIAVHPDYRGGGRGQLLVMKMMEEADLRGIKHFTLEVKTTNAAAIAMYKKLGFAIEGTRKNYYEYDHSDAYIMWRHSR